MFEDGYAATRTRISLNGYAQRYSRRRFLVIGGAALAVAPTLVASESAFAMPPVAFLTKAGAFAARAIGRLNGAVAADDVFVELEALLRSETTADLFADTSTYASRANTALGNTYESATWQKLTWQPHWFQPPSALNWGSVRYGYALDAQGDNIAAPFANRALAATNSYRVDPRSFIANSSTSPDAVELVAASVGIDVAQASRLYFTLPVLNGQAMAGLAGAAEEWVQYGYSNADQYGIPAESGILPLITLDDREFGTPWTSNYATWQVYLTATGTVAIRYYAQPTRVRGLGSVHVISKSFGTTIVDSWYDVPWG